MIAIHKDVFSVQYAENSTRDCVDNMNAGAVNEARSPLKDAIDYFCQEMATRGGLRDTCDAPLRTTTMILCSERERRRLQPLA